MDTKQFDILIKRRIPFVSNLLYISSIFFLAILLILYFFTFPAVHSKSSSEMQTAFFMFIVPNSLKTLSVYSIIGLLIVVPLYYSARLHKKAVLTLDTEKVLIKGEKIEIDLAKKSIDKIYFNDLKNSFREPIGKLQVVVTQKGGKQIIFRLKNYEQGGELIDALSGIEEVKFASYDFDIPSDHNDE